MCTSQCLLYLGFILVLTGEGNHMQAWRNPCMWLQKSPEAPSCMLQPPLSRGILHG